MTARRIASRLGLLATLTGIGLLAASPGGPAPAPATEGLPHVPGEILVGFAAGTRDTERAAVRSAIGARRIRSFARSVEQLSLGRGVDPARAIERLRRNPAVRFAEPNYLWRADVLPNDRLFAELYGLRNTGQTGGKPGADIGAEAAWDLVTGSREVVVGVIDSGIDYTHPDLAANIWTNPGEIPGNGKDDDGNGYVDDVRGWDFASDDNDPMDDFGHGTHVAGTIGAVADNGIGVAGVAWKVRLVPLKFIGSNGFGSTAAAIAAVEYATAIGADITNNSWGGAAASEALLDAIRASGEADVLFVAAAGNEGSNTDSLPHYPSSYDVPTILAVTAVDHNDARPLFANLGPRTVDLAAPGVNVLSTVPGGGYAFNSGTSMATPHVSGAAALVRSMARDIGALELKQLLMDHVDRLPNLIPVTVAGGRVNVAAALADRDRTAPGAIGGLVAESPTSNTVVLRWTATGDDGDAGTASAYEVRYAPWPIDETSFPRATRYLDAPRPAAAGEPEQLELAGLDAGTRFWFAIRAHDEWGNRGPVSSAADQTTLPAPSFASTPEAFDLALHAGDRATRSLEITNVGVGTLDWSVRPDPGAPWLATSPTAGRLAAGESAELTLSIDTRGAEPGELVGSLDLTTNDPLRPLAAHPVRVELASAPAIEVSPAALDFGEVFVGGALTLPLEIENFGTAPLTVDEIRTAATGVAVEPASASIEPGSRRTIDVTFAPQAAGPLAGELTVASDAPSAPVVIVPLGGAAAPPPAIEISPEALDVALLARTTETRTITIGNPGASPLVVDLRFAPGVSPGPSIAHPLVNGGFETGDFTGWQATNNGVFGRLDWEVAEAGAGLFENSAPYEGTQDALNGFEGGAGLRYDLMQDLAIPQGATRADLSFYDRIQWDDGGLPGQVPRTYEALIEDPAGGVLAVIVREEILFDGSGRHDLGWQRRSIDLLPWAGRTIRLRTRQLVTETLIGPAQLELDAFAIDLEGFPDWLLPGARRVVVAPGSSIDVDVRFDPGELLLGELDASIRLETNIPDRPLLLVPVRMAVSGVPRIALTGQRLEVESTRTYSTSGATTSHALTLPRAPGGAGTFELVTQSDVSDLGEAATLVVEGVALGLIGNTGSDCVPTSRSFDVDPARMIALGADGVVQATVVNSSTVAAVCNPNRHTVRLSYEARADLLEFGTVYSGSTTRLALTMRNPGTAPLEVVSIAADLPEFTASSSSAVIPVGGSLDLEVAFTPQQPGTFSGTLAIASNDPDSPSVPVRLEAHAVVAPRIAIDPAAIELELPVRGRGTRTLHLTNPGGAALEFTAAIEPEATFATVVPDAGSLPAGGGTDLELTVDAAGLDPGDYTAELRLDAADPAVLDGVVPLRLVVASTPDIAIEGRSRTVDSAQDFTGAGARTTHALAVDEPTAGAGRLRITVIGDFGAMGETALVRAEGMFLGAIGATGNDCVPYTTELEIATADLALLAADGVVEVEVQNTPTVGEVCPVNLHAARLSWQEKTEPLELAPTFVGFERTRRILIANRGTLPLGVSSVRTTVSDFSAPSEPFVLEPGESRGLDVRFAPASAGAVAAALEIGSDDPDEPVVFLQVQGLGVDPPVLELDPSALEVGLAAGDVATRALSISNGGAAPLHFTAAFEPPAPLFATLEPASGTLPAESDTEVTLRVDATHLVAGTFEAMIEVGSDDPLRPAVEIPLRVIVTGDPALSLSSEAIDFGETPVGGLRERALEIANRGTAPLAVAAAVPAGEFEPASLPPTIDPGESAWLRVVFRPTGEGARHAVLSLTTDDPLHPVVPIVLSGTGTAPAALLVEPARIDATLESGGSAAGRITIRNGGASALHVRLLGMPDAHDTSADPLPPTWAAVPPAPGPIACLVADPGRRQLVALLDGSVRVVRLDAVDGEWTELARAPLEASGTCAAAISAGRIYVAHAGRAHLGVYDIEADAWWTIRSPLADTTAIAAGEDGSLYLVRDKLGRRLDPRDGSVQPIAPPLFDFGARGVLVAHRGALYGHRSGGPLWLQAYDPLADRWTERAPLPQAAAPRAAIDPVSGDYYAPGASGSGVLLRHRLDDNAWHTEPLAPVGGGGADAGAAWLPDPVSGIVVAGGTELARRVTPSPFFTLAPFVGRLDRQQSVDVDVSFDAARLYAGTYGGIVEISSNDPHAQHLAVPLELRVTGAPHMSVSPTALDFGEVFVGAPRELVLSVANDGNGALEVGGIASASEEISVDPPRLTVPPKTSRQIRVRYAPLAAGALEASLDLASDDPATPHVSVALTGTAVPRPSLVLDPERLETALPEGGQLARSLRIANTGDGALEFSIGIEPAGAAFVAVEPSEGRIEPAEGLEVTVTFDARATGLGVHAAELRVLSNDPFRESFAIPATLTVGGVPQIAVGRAPVVLESTQTFRQTTTATTKTLHALRLDVPPSGSGTLELVAAGDYGNAGETVTLAGEGVTFGTAGPGTGDCGTLEASFPVAAGTLAALAADALVEIEARNSSEVSSFCPSNRHTVRLRYVGSADRLDYAIVFLGASRELALVLENSGTASLEIARIASDAPEFVPDVGALVVAAGTTEIVTVTFEPSATGTFAGHLVIESNDPDRPHIELALAGNGALAPAVELAPRALEVALPEGGTNVETLALGNAGAGPLTFTVAVDPTEATFVVPLLAVGSVAPGETLEIPIEIQTTGLEVGAHAATIEIGTNDPLEPHLSVPVELDVLGAPNLVHVGESVTVASEVEFTTQGALTRHTLPVAIPPFGDGRIEVVADGDFGQSIEFAVVSAEGDVIGSVGGVGADCIPAFGSFALDAGALASLVDDGVAQVEVQNNVNVDPGCAVNAHTVRLAYRARADRVDFDTVFVGQSKRRAVTLINEGHEPLEVLSIAAEPAEFAPLETALVLAPGDQASVSIDFSPLAPGPYSGTLTVTSNDPDTPRLVIPLDALAAEPPGLSVSDAAIERTLLEGERETAPLVLRNSGASPLDFSLELREPEDFEAGFTLFGTDGGGGGLYTIDPETAHATFIGSMGIGAPSLAVDPTTGVMYVGQGGGSAVLYTVDPRTAVIRLVGDSRLGEAAIEALDFDAAGTLYASVNIVDGPGTGGDHLARIDTSTGEATVLGPFGNGIGTAGGLPGLAGLAFDPATGVLYGASAAHAATVGPPALYRIDLATGEASFLARIVNGTGQSVPGGVGSLQFLPDGTLVGGTGRGTGGDLIRIDLATGRYELVGHAVSGPLGALALRRNPADLSFVDVAPVTGTVPPFDERPVEVTLDARALPPGTYRARLGLATNDPAHADVEIPVGLEVVGVPDIVVAGDTIALESTEEFTGDGGTTTHTFALDRPSAGGATLELAVEGDFGAASEVAELRIGDLTLGSVGNTGADCVGDSGTFVLAARDFAEVASGGSVVADVINTQPVSAVVCSDSLHTVRLSYHTPLERLDFGTVYVGHPHTLPLRLENHGRAELTIDSIEAEHAEIALEATLPIVIQPFGAVEIPVTFAPQAAGLLAASLGIRSSDPDEPEVRVALAGQALGAPIAEATPGSIRAALAPRGVRPTRRVVRLYNRGTSNLAFSAELLERVPQTAPWEPLAKGDESANGAGADLSAERRGGPDSFGYRFADSDGLDGPRFEWVEHEGGGTPLALAGDDESSDPLPIGFAFPFYGATFEFVNVSSNGWLSFSSDLTSYSNAPSLPNVGSTVPENLLAAFWDDLDLRGAASIRYGGDAERFVVQYTDVNRFASAAQLTFQVVLHASGRIVFQYLSMTGTLDSATVGIQNGARTAGLVAAYNEPYVHDGLAVEFAPIAPWAAVTPASGIVAPGAFAELAVELRSADLEAGEREAELVVRSNDPVQRELTVPVRLRTATVSLESFELRPAVLQASARSGPVTAVLELPQGFDPHDVVLATVRIEDTVAPATHPPKYADEDGDGIEELYLQFDRRELVRLLGDGETATVEISGEIDGRSWFTGTAEIHLLPRTQRGRPRS